MATEARVSKDRINIAIKKNALVLLYFFLHMHSQGYKPNEFVIKSTC